MKTKSLFLLKVLGCSLLLFACWHPLSRGYGTLIDQLLRLVHPQYRQLHISAGVYYYDSMPLILLISLVVATPRIQIMKKGFLVLIGILAFGLLNFVRIRLNLNPSDTTAWLAYGGIKTVLPFVVWIGGAFRQVGEMLSMQPQPRPVAVGRTCPLCQENHVDFRGHLQAAHGEKSLRIKKVKRFLAQKPEAETITLSTKHR